MSPALYTRDLETDYLTARAFRDGLDFFTPISELSVRYFPVPTVNFPHASFHPPLLAILGVPLTFVSFPVALRFWLAINICLLLAIGRLLSLSASATLALAAWPPLWAVLVLGQLELVILGLAMLAWREAERRHDLYAGILIGVAGALKLYPFLLVVPYVTRARLRVALGAVATFTLAQVASMILVGPSVLLRYYAEILPSVSGVYAPLGLNVSPYGALLRLFGGSADIAPAVHAPALVLPLALCCSMVGLVGLCRMAPPAAPAAVFVSLPTVWYYHPVVALPQLVWLFRSEHRVGALCAAAAMCAIFPLVNATFEYGLLSAAPPMGALLASIEPIGIVLLFWLSGRTLRSGPLRERVSPGSTQAQSVPPPSQM